MRESTYITHDFGARNDPKMMRLQMKMGGQGLAIFWCLVEILWENGGYVEYDPEAIAFTLRWATPEEVERVITEFNLFNNDGTRFWSQSALDRIELKRESFQAKSEAGRKGNEARWGKNKEEIADQSHSDSTAIASQSHSDRYYLLTNLLNKNKSFSFSFSKGDEQELLAAYFTFRKNVQNPNRETAKFLAFNNTDGRVWDDMPEKARRKAFDAWEQQPPGRPRFDRGFLSRWASFCDAVAASGAPQRVRMAALADGVKYEAEGGTFRLWCPDVLRDWVEHHIPDAGKALMAVAQGEGCQKLAYRKCAESVK